MQNHPSSPYWEHENPDALYKAMIGLDYGASPLEQIEKIRKDKERTALYILKLVKADKNSYGLEIGSGCGYLTRVAAKETRSVIACDISKTFLSAAKSNCSDFNNILYVHVRPGDFSFLQNQSLDYVFSNNVFIHLDIYEIYHYISEISRSLKVGGYFWFDFAEVERSELVDCGDFISSVAVRKVDPVNKGCIQFNSMIAIERIAKSFNLKVKKRYRGGRCNTSLLLQKKGESFIQRLLKG